jgi:hypothetical protein
MDNLNIRQFKLLNNEDVIAVLNTKNDDNYLIERPVVLLPNLLGNMQFEHWFPLSSQKVFKLYKNRVIQHVPVDEYLHESYIDFVLNTTRPQYKFQSFKEAAQEYIKLREEYIDEDLPASTIKVPVKETIH